MKVKSSVLKFTEPEVLREENRNTLRHTLSSIPPFPKIKRQKLLFELNNSLCFNIFPYHDVIATNCGER